MHLGKTFKFHPNLDLKNFSLEDFPKYYQEIIYRFSKYLSSPPSLLSLITSQFLWLNKDIKIDNECVIVFNFSKNGIYFVGQHLLIQDHHLIKKNQILCLTKLNSNELYKIQIIIKYEEPAS